jgi:hypothetical protein
LSKEVQRCWLQVQQCCCLQPYQLQLQVLHPSAAVGAAVGAACCVPQRKQQYRAEPHLLPVGAASVYLLLLLLL